MIEYVLGAISFALVIYAIFLLCRIIFLAIQEGKNPQPVHKNHDWRFREVKAGKWHTFHI